MIRSVYGLWKGNCFRGLTEKTILGKQILVNETKWRIVYSTPDHHPDELVGEIGVDQGEAICFIKPGKSPGKVVIGPEAEVVTWIKYYFFEPHKVPNKVQNLKIQKAYLQVCGVSVSREVLQSYGSDVVIHLQKYLRAKYRRGSEERKVLETLMLTMNKPSSQLPC